MPGTRALTGINTGSFLYVFLALFSKEWDTSWFKKIGDDYFKFHRQVQLS